ncbi:hypothetical protein SMCF_8764, partial [Streptomyces coelicoflavus ZG0656]
MTPANHQAPTSAPARSQSSHAPELR